MTPQPAPQERAPGERLVNLMVSLETSTIPRTFAQLRADTRAYVQDDDESARRMFERDKDTLRRMGVPIETVELAGVSGYVLDRDAWRGTTVDLDRDEVTALVVGIGLAGGQRERLALSRLTARAPDPDDPEAPAVPSMRLPLSDHGLDVVAHAVADHATLRFGYRRADGHEATRTVDAWGLVMRNGAAYLIGWDHDRDARRTFRLSRVTSRPRVVDAQATDPPDDFDVATVLDEPHGDGTDVRVLVRTDLVGEVERRGGVLDGGPAVETPDEAAWHRATFPDADAQRLMAWLWANAASVVVREPDWLHDQLRDGLEQVADRTAQA